MNELKICPKKRYETQNDARKMISYLISLKETVKLKTYKCHICHNYHLTSKR